MYQAACILVSVLERSSPGYAEILRGSYAKGRQTYAYVLKHESMTRQRRHAFAVVAGNPHQCVADTRARGVCLVA